jgi:predicted DNA-binding protein (UPF0251 family)
MARPQKNRIVAHDPDVCYFKPRGVPLKFLEEVHLTIDEMEALRLADLNGLNHEDAGRQMGVSRATFGRIVQRARHQVAQALINGMAIRVAGGNYQIIRGERQFRCRKCHHQWQEKSCGGRPQRCPVCGHGGLECLTTDL